MLQYKPYIIKSLVYIAKCMLSINESEGSQKTQSGSEMARGSRLNQKETRRSSQNPRSESEMARGSRLDQKETRRPSQNPRWPEDLV